MYLLDLIENHDFFITKYLTKLHFCLFLYFMGPSNVFRQSSLDDIDNIALFKKVFLPKIIMKTLFVKISKIWISF